MKFKVQKEVLDSGVKIVFAAVEGMDFCGGSVVIDPLGNITARFSSFQLRKLRY